MPLCAPTRCFNPNDPELIDRPGLDRALLHEELRLLEDLNRRLSGHKLVLESIERLIGLATPKSLSILDLGTGSADIPRAIVNWARKKKIAVTITAVDGNSEILQFARESCHDWPEIQFAQHDLRSLPYAKNSFDVVLCSLALHHFNSMDAVAVLRRINGIARTGYTVNDLRRNWLSIWFTELLVRTVIHSKIFRHDAPKSCRAAFSIGELRTLGESAGLKNFRVTRHHWIFRMILQGKK
ncbi:MAG: methyltransferase domain-containing protein [Limisphaerales bacterium]